MSDVASFDFIRAQLELLVMWSLPVIAAIYYKHADRWPICVFAVILIYFEELHGFQQNAADWPMVGWIALFIWSFAGGRTRSRIGVDQ